jgi:rare lipoprotein A
VKQRIDELGSVQITTVRVNGASLYRVRLGPVASVEEADRLLARVLATGFGDARIVVD